MKNTRSARTSVFCALTLRSAVRVLQSPRVGKANRADVLHPAAFLKEIDLFDRQEILHNRAHDSRQHQQGALFGHLSQTGGESLHCDKLIIACGGLAGTKLGGSMSGYKLLHSMGHGCTRLRPTLVQLKTDWPGVSALKGVRAECRAEISRDGEPWSESSGEIQFTEYGLSGPVIFEISRDVCQRKGDWFCCLDLLPQLTEQALAEMLFARRKTGLNAGELFTGILHNRLGRVLVQETGIGLNTPIAQLPEKALHQAAANAKCFRVHLTEPLGMDSAQVTAGGIVTGEFDPTTMESKLVPGLYACGEVLDVDGDCGGYNLQWAWSSGSLAGMYAGEAESC